MPSSMTEMKTGSTRLALPGVIFVGFLVVLALFLSNSWPGVYCSKIGKLSNRHLGHSKAKEAASSKYSPTAVAAIAATSSLNKTKSSEKNENAMEVQNEVIPRSHSTRKGGGEAVSDAEFETQDYDSGDRTPALKQPPHKLTPNR